MLAMRRFRPVILALAALGAAAATVGPSGASAGDGSALLIHEGVFAVEDLSWQRLDGGAFAPRLPGVRTLNEADRPLLGVQSLQLLVPAGAAVDGVEIVPLQTRRVPLPGRLQGGLPLTSSEGVAVAQARLKEDAGRWPSVWGEFAGVQIYRGFHLAGVLVYPFRAVRDAAGQWSELELLERYAVRLSAGAKALAPAETAVRERWVPGERTRVEARLRGLVANPAALAGYARADGEVIPEPAGGFAPSRTPSIDGSSVRLLIITGDALASEFQRLADHKTAHGYPAVVKTASWIAANYRQGADLQETMRFFIREAYARWGVEYVLLGGDTDVLPARFVTSNYYPPGGTTDIPADLYFACLDGNWNADGDYIFGEPYYSYLYPGDNADLADEVYLGRATVSTPAAAAVFVDKVIAYEEKGPGATHLDKMLFAAEVLFPSNYTPGGTITLDGATFADQIYNNYLLPCTAMTATRMYESYPLWPGSVPLTRAAVIDQLSSGQYGVVNQIGHGYYFNMSVGDANFTVGDADLLHNGQNTFLLYALNCASAAFDFACLMERFVQNAQGGSVASIGASRAAFPYTSNDYQGEFFSQLFCGATTRLGELMSLSRLPMLAETYFNTVDRWTFMCYTLLGDPSLALWTGAPRTPVVTAPSSLSAGAQTVPVNVTAGGSPVAGAVVCLAKEGDDYAWGTTDLAGNCTLAFTPTSGGTALLTVSDANVAMTRRSVPISTSGAYIALDSVTIVDDGSGGTVGNGDGRLDAGETVALWPRFRDTGSGGALNCAAVLAGGGPGVTIVDATAAVGNVPSGGFKNAVDPFVIQLAAGLTDGTFAPFQLTVTAGGGGSYASEWTPVVLAPEVEAIALSWSDIAYGDGDGVREDNERLTIQVTLKNFGAGLSRPLTARLRTADPSVTLYDTAATVAPLALLGSGQLSTPFSLAMANVAANPWSWVLFTDDRGRTFRHNFRLNPPAAPSGLQSQSAQGPGVITLRWLPMSAPGQRGYNVYRSTQTTGPFTRANGDLINGVSYFRDTGLQLLTQYYYRITAVDSSLVEGPFSLTIAQSTNPAETPGFPLPFPKETSGHAAVGDINGDGVLDVVLGAEKMYAWNALGQELLDGDDNAQTHGPISPITGNWGPAGIALAHLDDQPGLDIVAVERNTLKVYCMRWDGTPLPGWPQSLVGNWAWATPAVGDVDGDGEPEIVVNGLNGRTYVWHKNGTELRDGDNNSNTNGVFVYRSEAQNEWCMSSPALFDIDGDGACEIIFGSKLLSPAQNYLYAYRFDGTQPAGFPYPVGGRIACSPSVADVNNDGIWEIAFVSANGQLHLLQQNGTPYPGFPVAMTANDLSASPSCPSPAFGDFTGDGRLELVAVSTVNATNATLRIYSTNTAAGTSGQILPGWPRSVGGASESSPVVGDLNGDGQLDILHGVGGSDESTADNIYAFRADGTMLPGFPITLGGPIRPAAIICDFDLDGDVDIVYGGWDLQLHVWDMPFAYDRRAVPWGTFRGHHTRDGVFRPTALVDVPPDAAPPPLSLLLPQNHPNPFNPATTIRLHLPGTAGQRVPLKLAIYDVQGRLVRVLHDGDAPTGWLAWTWDGCDGSGRRQASGVYFARARSLEQALTRKMMMVK